MRYIDLVNYKGYSLTLWIPETTPITKIRASIKRLKLKLKKYLPSRKLYPQGRNGLKHFDTRTNKERLNDWLCDHIFDRPRKYKERTGVAKLYSFITFFDDANGREVWNWEQIKDAERTGQVMLSHREAEREYKRAKAYNDMKFHKKSKDLFLQKLIQVDKGYKYSEQFKNRVEFNRDNLRKQLEREAAING